MEGENDDVIRPLCCQSMLLSGFMFVHVHIDAVVDIPVAMATDSSSSSRPVSERTSAVRLFDSFQAPPPS